MGKGLISGSGISGFKHSNYSTYKALAEIIDNSVQAGAENIHIAAIQDQRKLIQVEK